MEIEINGEKRELEAPDWTVRDLMDELDVEQRTGVAVAVNDAVVPRSQWEDHALNDGDDVEVIRATQGG